MLSRLSGQSASVEKTRRNSENPHIWRRRREDPLHVDEGLHRRRPARCANSVSAAARAGNRDNQDARAPARRHADFRKSGWSGHHRGGRARQPANCDSSSGVMVSVMSVVLAVAIAAVVMLGMASNCGCAPACRRCSWIRDHVGVGSGEGNPGYLRGRACSMSKPT